MRGRNDEKGENKGKQNDGADTKGFSPVDTLRHVWRREGGEDDRGYIYIP